MGKPGGLGDGWRLLLIVVALAAVVTVSLMARPEPKPDATDRGIDDPPPSTTEPASDPAPAPAPSPTEESPIVDEDDLAEDLFGGELPSGVSLPQGLGGSGSGKSLPRKDLVIEISSDQPVHRVSYLIPTSDDERAGRDESVGKTWTHRTKVWGKPDYAAVFVHAIYPGVSVTCTIKVEGRVTERRTIVGPYAAMWCQG